MQQGHTPAYYRDHPQDIRHRTVQSRKPPPLPSKLIKSDPDSATSPSKYEGRELSGNDSSDSEAPKRNRPARKPKKKKKTSETTPATPNQNAPSAQHSGIVISKQAQEQAERELANNKKVWSQNRDLLNRDIQKFLHKSKTKFAIDEVKHAMDNAKILHRAESVSDDIVDR